MTTDLDKITEETLKEFGISQTGPPTREEETETFLISVMCSLFEGIEITLTENNRLKLVQTLRSWNGRVGQTWTHIQEEKESQSDFFFKFFKDHRKNFLDSMKGGNAFIPIDTDFDFEEEDKEEKPQTQL